VAVEAVIWDFGGVFTTSPFEAFNRYEAAHGIPKDLIRTVNATNPLENAWALFERAQIDRSGFDMKFLEESTALGHPVRGADVLPLLAGDVRPRMVEALKLCKRHFKVACITNNMAQGHGPGMAASPEGASRSAGIMALFDVIVESSKAGIRKPDPRIYQIACNQLGVAPSVCVYLDDLGVNCKPAAELGMKAQALDDLAAATGLDFPLAVAA
jgi:putative hydrolase of the HAD superfamily